MAQEKMDDGVSRNERKRGKIGGVEMSTCNTMVACII